MNIIEKYFTHLTDEQKKQIAALDELYRDWNNKINVISRKDIDNLYEHHVLHSMAIAKAYAGNIGALGRLGIATKDAEGKTMTFEQVMARAVATFGGSAATAATTTAGKMAVLKARFAAFKRLPGVEEELEAEDRRVCK